MPRIRTIKPEFFFDADLAGIGTIAQLFFVGLWCQADKAGRMRDEPIVLKAKIFPYKNIDGDKILTELTPRFLTRYAGKDGKKYIQINNFLLHQRPHHTEAESTIPPLTVNKRLRNRSLTTYKGKGREGKGKGKEGSPTGDCDYFPKTPVQFIVSAYKLLLDVKLEDREWDQENFSRCSKAAASLLKAFNGDHEAAINWMQQDVAKLKSDSLDWTLETLSKRAWRTRGQRYGNNPNTVDTGKKA